MSFVNKVVIVTGASGGLGSAISLRFAGECAKLVLVGRNEEKLKHISHQCEEIGGENLIVIADVLVENDIKMIIDKTVEKFEKIDVLVNNAGIIREMKFMGENFLEIFDEIMQMNLRTAVNLTWLATPFLIKTNGNIVNISSVAGTKVKKPNLIAYSTSKAALDNFSITLAMELAPFGVRVNVVSPGPVKTNIFNTPGINMDVDKLKNVTALHRISEPSEIADLVFFIASDKGKSMTGSNCVCDNGCLLMGSDSYNNIS